MYIMIQNLISFLFVYFLSTRIDSALSLQYSVFSTKLLPLRLAIQKLKMCIYVHCTYDATALFLGVQTYYAAWYFLYFYTDSSVSVVKIAWRHN